MEFGTWLREQRATQGLDVQQLALKVGISASTISRVENRRAKVTLATAIRICAVLGVSVEDLAAALVRRPTSLVDVDATHADTFDTLTSKDIASFADWHRRNAESATQFVARLLTHVAQCNKDTGQQVDAAWLEYDSRDVARFISSTPVCRFELNYPPILGVAALHRIFAQGGVLTLADLGTYVREMRRSVALTVGDLLHDRREAVAHAVGGASFREYSASFFSRLEAGSTERIKLEDVLFLDELLGGDGRILSLYWSALELNIDLVGEAPLEDDRDVSQLRLTSAQYRLVVVAITACRWLQQLNPDDTSWLTELRTLTSRA